MPAVDLKTHCNIGSKNTYRHVVSNGELKHCKLKSLLAD